MADGATHQGTKNQVGGKAGLHDTRSDHALSLRGFFQVIIYAAMFSFYTIIVLIATDYVLSRSLPGYQYSGRYVFGGIVFFLAGTIFTLYGRWRRWRNWRYFIIGALAVFFPLVFLSSTIRLYISADGPMIQGYVQRYCETASSRVCGEAFAASVFAMSLRALPTVLTAPALYWYLLFRRRGTGP